MEMSVKSYRVHGEGHGWNGVLNVAEDETFLFGRRPEADKDACQAPTRMALTVSGRASEQPEADETAMSSDGGEQRWLARLLHSVISSRHQFTV